MCGIFCSVCNENEPQSIDVDLHKLLLNRGPDYNNSFCKGNVLFGGFVLWHQGATVTPQPLSLNNWTLLLNGDIFNRTTVGESSDTNWLIKEISTCKDENSILELFRSLKGPYSLIMFNQDSGYLYFARDPLGRNSLLIERDSGHLRILSNSLIYGSKLDKVCMELPPYGLYKVNVQIMEDAALYPWISLDKQVLEDLPKLLPHIKVNGCINPKWMLPLENKFQESFDFYQLCTLKTIEGLQEDIHSFLLKNKNVKTSICEFLDLLRLSVKERVLYTTKFCSECISNLKSNCNHSKIGILFSGGIDCTILAVIADEFVNKNEPIDLINVAFEVPNAKETNWDVPDRCSAKESLEELMRICPRRIWKLVEINVTREELSNKLETHIKHLIYPLNTVLDESLGCAFWFASRGQGYCNGEPYISPSRVILIGSGADELFGGYTRHRNAYTRYVGSHEDKILNVFNELQMDCRRLPMRNLGRDDRVIADNSKTSRAPFLQEDLVLFARSLKAQQRCCFALEQGIGDKLFLRLSGYHLGLRSSVKLKKRAIQFGSRIANKKQNAKDISINIK